MNLIETNATKNQERFFGKLGGVEYYYYFAFFIIFTISCNQKGSVTLRMHQIARGSAPDSAGGAHDAPPKFLVGWGEGYFLPISLPSTPAAPHLEFGGIVPRT